MLRQGLMNPRKKTGQTKRIAFLAIFSGIYLVIAYKFPIYAQYQPLNNTLRNNIDSEFKRKSETIKLASLKEITIKSPTLYIDNYITETTTVGETLKKIGIEVKDSYVLNLPIESTIVNGSYIKIDEIISEIVVETESIAYFTEKVEDNSMFIDESIIIQNGNPGEKEMKYKITYKNGEQTSKELLEEEITNNPQNEIIAIGTRPKQETIEGNSLTYTQKLTMYATSYDGNCFGCTGRTYTGTSVTKGVVAVDPNIIPLYTKLYIPGYGFAQALDIGGGIKGNMIDLGFANLAEVQGAWSARYTEVYVLQ